MLKKHGKYGGVVKEEVWEIGVEEVRFFEKYEKVVVNLLLGKYGKVVVREEWENGGEVVVRKSWDSAEEIHTYEEIVSWKV